MPMRSMSTETKVYELLVEFSLV